MRRAQDDKEIEAEAKIGNFDSLMVDLCTGEAIESAEGVWEVYSRHEGESTDQTASEKIDEQTQETLENYEISSKYRYTRRVGNEPKLIRC